MPACAAHSTPASPAKPEAMAKATHDQAVYVEARRAARRQVLGRGAHAEPRIGARHEPPEKGQRDAGEHDGHDIDLGEGDLRHRRTGMAWFIQSGSGKFRGELVKIRMPRFSRM